MPNTMRFLPKVLFVLSAQGLLPSLAVAAIDAGALQQNLEKQLPPSRTLPEPSKAKPLAAPSKDSEVRFIVNAFALEGVSILPESQVQAVLKPYLGIELTFAQLEKRAMQSLTFTDSLDILFKQSYCRRACPRPVVL